MIAFSILCTNSRNGGQTELLIEAANAADAEQHVLRSRPHFIIKKTWVVARKFVCVGWNLRRDLYDELSYMAESADAARERCMMLNPEFAIDRVEEDMRSFATGGWKQPLRSLLLSQPNKSHENRLHRSLERSLLGTRLRSRSHGGLHQRWLVAFRQPRGRAHRPSFAHALAHQNG